MDRCDDPWCGILNTARGNYSCEKHGGWTPHAPIEETDMPIDRTIIVALALLLMVLGANGHARAASVSASSSASSINGTVSVDLSATEGATATGSATDGDATISHTVIGPGEFHMTAHEHALAARAAARERAASFGTGKP